ncbi:MAG TPA: DUF6680 family protein [Rhizomicrobium sp.]
MVDGSTIGIVIATFTGPVAAVIVTRWVDKLRDAEKRKIEVFRSMMRSRRLPLSADYVGALNLVAVEFHGRNKVMSALKELMNHFDDGYGVNKTLDELKAANDKSDALRTSLLSAMATTLGYRFEQMEIHRGGYAPQGWGVELDEQAISRRGLSELLSGRRTLPVTVVTAAPDPVAQGNAQQQVSPFPPKPG